MVREFAVVGIEKVTVGPLVFTVNVVEGPAESEVLPAVSEAVPADIEIPKVPSPLIEEIVTVLVDVPVPETTAVPVAVPVLFKVIFPFAKVTESAPE